MILAAVISVILGSDPATNREMAYLWDGNGIIVEARGALWAEVSGEGEFRLPVGRVIRRVWTFAGVDRGSCFEGDVNLTRGGVAVSLAAPHKEAAEGIYDAWSSVATDYPTDGAEPFRVRYVCRVTCGTSARCHFGVQLLLERR